MDFWCCFDFEIDFTLFEQTNSSSCIDMSFGMTWDVGGGDSRVELVEDKESSNGGNEYWLSDIRNSPLQE